MGRNAPDYKSERCYAGITEIRDLIIAGARIIRLNESVGGYVLHEVEYKEHSFISTSERSISFPVIQRN